jgi:hypothetical protein
MKRMICIGFACAAVFSVGVFSADDDWTVYLNSSAVYRIRCLGDSLWCSTSGGVLLFDLIDSTFTHYYNGLDFPSTEVRDVAVDGSGSVWFGFSTKGIVRVDDLDTDPVTARYDELHNELLTDSITCLLAVGSDVYYGSTAGVAWFHDGDHATVPGLTTGLTGKVINDLFERLDTLWIACDDGVAFFDPQSIDVSFFPLGRVTGICDYDGFVHCAGDTGTVRFIGGSWEPVGSLDFSPLSIASGGGEMVCVTKERAYRWNGLDWSWLAAGGMNTLFYELYGLDWKDILRTVAVDERGTPWIGGVLASADRGAYVSGYINGAWVNSAPSQISHNRIVELAAGDDGGVWASTNVYGIGYLLNGDRWTLYTRWRDDWGDEALSYPADNLAILFDSQGYFWCNVLDHDLDRIRIHDPLVVSDDEWDHFAIGEGTITTNRFVKAKEDPAGNRWFLSDAEALGMRGINIRGAGPDDGWFNINHNIESEMGEGGVFDCAFSGTGSVILAIRGFGVQQWFTGGFGWSSLTNLEDDRWYSLIDDEDLPSTILNSIRSIARDENGTLYVGTSSGLVRYRQGIIDFILKRDEFTDEGLIGSTVYDIELDGSGNLWLATDGGLNRIGSDGTIAAFTSAEHWESELQLIYSTDVISPLPHHICRALQYDPIEDALWIGTDNGLVRLDVSLPAPEPLRLSELILYPNPIHISRGDSGLFIGRISEPVSVRVYTIEGELVHEVSGIGAGDAAWDLMTINGFKARSGVYIVRIDGSDGSEVRKIAVVR